MFYSAIYGIVIKMKIAYAPFQWPLPTGLLHSALTTTVTGIALVGLRYPLHTSNPLKWPLPDKAKIGIKLFFVLNILALAFTNRKKETISSNVWATIGALTIGNIIIAVVWAVLCDFVRHRTPYSPKPPMGFEQA
ncbi:MAG: hypothetical protein ACKO3D_02395 [Actinomycetota bacterium]